MGRVGGGVVGGFGGGGEDAAGVDTGELSRFRDGPEDLGVGEWVNGEVVDGFMEDRGRGVFR